MRPASAEPRTLAHRLLDGLLLVFAPLAVAVRPLMPAHAGEGNLWVAMCVFLALMAWALLAAFTRRVRLVSTGVGLPLLALLAVAGVSTLRSPHAAASVATLREWGCYAAVFFLLVHEADGRLRRHQLLALLWASAFVVILYGLLQQFVNLPLLLKQIESDPDRVRLELRLDPRMLNDLGARAQGRIFSTFLLANCFAGFLILVIPGFLGQVLDRLRAGQRGVLFLSSSALWLLGAFACLAYTGSKGGWVAFAATALLFAVLLAWGWLRRHARLIGLGAAILLALFLSGLLRIELEPDVPGSFDARLHGGALRLRVLRDTIGSADVRWGYWLAAAGMIRDHPIAGVGLGTFGSHYARYRYLTARVAQEAHNDHLQVLAELGIVGLLPFLAVWVAWLLRACRWQASFPDVSPPAEVAGPSRPPRRWFSYAIGLLALSLCSTVETAFTFAGWGTEPWWPVPKVWCDWALVLALALAWMLFFRAFGRAAPLVPGSLCHKGLVCGVVGFLLHCLVDFDYNEPGVAFTAWAVAALSLVPRREPAERPLRRAAALALGAAAILGMVAFQLHLTRRVRATAERDLARGRMTEAARGTSTRPQSELLREARDHFEEALRLSPLDDELRMEYADFLHSQLMHVGYQDPRLFADTAELYARAAELNHPLPAPHHRLAQLFERAADAGAHACLDPFVRRLRTDRSAPRNPLYAPAVAAYDAARLRDPHRPSLFLQSAIAYEKYGDTGVAWQYASHALYLQDILLQKHPEHVMRLLPEELAQARALLSRVSVRK